MAGGEQSQPEQQPQPSTAAKPMSAEEEFLKRNTDCVYFLASPLTCKKGAECEYRHSDIARVNPRDCWYWLNGNCLNPKCAFRHPPLDGLLETQVQTPLGSSQAPMQTALMPVASAPLNPGKQAVPCIFFQKGYCLKGQLCPFMHGGPSAVNNKVPPAGAATSASDPPALKKVFGGLEKCNQEQKIFSQENFRNSVELHPQGKPQAKGETAVSRKDVVTDRHAQSHLDLNEWPPRYKPTNVPPATNGNSVGRSSRVQQVHAALNTTQQVHGSDDHVVLNNKDADEFSREPSPGFDVLVEDDLRETDYYHNESNYGGTRDHEGKNQNSANDYDMVHPDYNPMGGDVERNMYREPRDYDSYEYARDHRRGSSERVSSHVERRRYPRSDSPDRVNESDLRYRLSKQKRGNNGLRSVISHDRSRDNYGEDRSFRGSSRRDVPSSEVSVSSRLRGRIKLPGRSSSPVNGTDFRPERERNRARLSPVRPHQGRLRDRISGRVQENVNNNEDRSFRGLRTRDDNNNNAGFSAPRSLAQLKGGGKMFENNEQQQINGQPSSSLGKRKFPPPLESQKQAENDISFEGPKPLSEILKRKKSAVTTTPKEEDKEATDIPNLESAAQTNEEELTVGAGLAVAQGDGSVPSGETNEVETEEGLIVDEEELEDHEAFDQGEEGVYDYEHAEGEDYNLEEGENPEGEEYLDEEDDGDDFAKKIGVMFS